IPCGLVHRNDEELQVVLLLEDARSSCKDENVTSEAERLNAIRKRLNGRLCERLIRGSIRDSVGSSFGGSESRYFGNWYMFETEGRFEASGSFGTSGSSRDKLLISVTNLGLLIDGKEDLTCVETLYRWVVGFDEVLVVESNMTKISKLKRWFSLQNNFAISELGGASTCLLKN
nr:hypothetical protein [Tanacetum cinerariifolium]